MQYKHTPYYYDMLLFVCFHLMSFLLNNDFKKKKILCRFYIEGRYYENTIVYINTYEVLQFNYYILIVHLLLVHPETQDYLDPFHICPEHLTLPTPCLQWELLVTYKHTLNFAVGIQVRTHHLWRCQEISIADIPRGIYTGVRNQGNI